MRYPILILLYLVLFFTTNCFSQNPYIMVLGVAQDAGYPQVGCKKECCTKVNTGKAKPQMVASLALIDPSTKEYWLFDATPDFTKQINLVQATGDFTLKGIFLTHAHMGHYTGLMYLGREAMSSVSMPVYAMPRMRQFLQNNGPWKQLVELKNIEIIELNNRASIKLNSKISVTPFLVPHRDEYSETVGYEIKTASKSAFYIPDIDKWEKWETNLLTLVKKHDYALLDATFFKDGEINRPMKEVPHPFVTETMEVLQPLQDKSKVIFIHLNHTNPLLNTKSIEYKKTTEAGFNIASEGMKIKL